MYGLETSRRFRNKEEYLKVKIVNLTVRLFLARQLPVGQDLLIHDVSRSHTTALHSR